MNNIGSTKGLVALVLLICFIQQGFSIKCWVCRSDRDPKCADPFDNTTVPITDCSTQDRLEHLPDVKPTMCRKIRQKVYGQWTYFRSCAYLGEPGLDRDERFCLMRTGSYNIFMEYCTCNTKDGCNSGTSFSISWLTTAIAGVLAIASSLLIL
ncbi:uncharacterized protein [Fopius arisanus]|uniref:Protein sleepless n=1 Tax=Fopius arisanus TaxID=64838 RepID=A0A9R1U1H6_9HYME|nr:PREDICTED: uncharacterized protein LOC105268051 [Fopius arisanus]